MNKGQFRSLRNAKRNKRLIIIIYNLTAFQRKSEKKTNESIMLKQHQMLLLAFSTSHLLIFQTKFKYRFNTTTTRKMKKKITHKKLISKYEPMIAKLSLFSIIIKNNMTQANIIIYI